MKEPMKKFELFLKAFARPYHLILTTTCTVLTFLVAPVLFTGLGIDYTPPDLPWEFWTAIGGVNCYYVKKRSDDKVVEKQGE